MLAAPRGGGGGRVYIERQHMPEPGFRPWPYETGLPSDLTHARSHQHSGLFVSPQSGCPSSREAATEPDELRCGHLARQ